MAEVRKKTILSTAIIYIGFAIGALNTYLFSKENFFTVEEYGLTRVFLDIVVLMSTVSMMGIPSAVYKFFPFYSRNLKSEENDMLAGSLLLAVVGFVVLLLVGWLGKDLFMSGFSDRSPLLVKYYNWLFPAVLFLTLFTITEAFGWHLEKIGLTHFLRETLFRILTSILIALKLTGVISFHTLMIGFSLQYAVLFFILLYYMLAVQQFKLVFSISRVTRKFFRKMVMLICYVYIGGVIHSVANLIGAILIARNFGLKEAGIYTFANYFVTLLQAPQRSIISISTPMLANAWKDKDFDGIRRIYQRSSINMLISAFFMFTLIWLCMDTAVAVFKINPSFLNGKTVFLIIGVASVIELGTGVNSQIIGTSNDWRFEFFSGVILLGMTIPLNYFLVKEFGMSGAAFSTLASIVCYNAIRFVFIWRKYGLQPFTTNTLKLFLIAVLAYAITYLCGTAFTGLTYLIVIVLVFSILYLVPIYIFKVTPDMAPVLNTIMKRAGIRK